MTADSPVEAQLTEALADALMVAGWTSRFSHNIAAALVPVVAQHVEDARTDERERIAAAIEKAKPPTQDKAHRASWHLGIKDAARIARNRDETAPAPLAYTTHDDYDDEPPEYTRDEEAAR